MQFDDDFECYSFLRSLSDFYFDNCKCATIDRQGFCKRSFRVFRGCLDSLDALEQQVRLISPCWGLKRVLYFASQDRCRCVGRRRDFLCIPPGLGQLYGKHGRTSVGSSDDFSKYSRVAAFIEHVILRQNTSRTVLSFLLIELLLDANL